MRPLLFAAAFAPLLLLAACTAPDVGEPIACAGERAKFCGPEGTELSPPPPPPESPTEPQNDAVPPRRTDVVTPVHPLLRPAPEASRVIGVIEPR